MLSPEDLKHLIVDDKHGLIYCYVPKVGHITLSSAAEILDQRFSDCVSLSHRNS